LPFRSITARYRDRGGAYDDGRHCEARFPDGLGPGHVASKFSVPGIHPAVQRFPPNPAFRAAPTAPNPHDCAFNLALLNKLENPLTGRACDSLCVIDCDPTRALLHRRRKIAMLAANQAVPLFDYELLEGVPVVSRSSLTGKHRVRLRGRLSVTNKD